MASSSSSASAAAAAAPMRLVVTPDAATAAAGAVVLSAAHDAPATFGAGRADTNALRINDHHCSRVQARIEWRPPHAFVVAAGNNATVLERPGVPARTLPLAAEVQLLDGDVVILPKDRRLTIALVPVARSGRAGQAESPKATLDLTDPETDEDAHDGGDRVSADEGGEDAASVENGVLRLQNGRYVATPESSDLEGEDAVVHGDDGVPSGDAAAFGAFALRERPKLLSKRAGVPDAVVDLLLDEQWASLGPHEREVFAALAKRDAASPKRGRKRKVELAGAGDAGPPKTAARIVEPTADDSERTKLLVRLLEEDRLKEHAKVLGVRTGGRKDDIIAALRAHLDVPAPLVESDDAEMGDFDADDEDGSDA